MNPLVESNEKRGQGGERGEGRRKKLLRTTTDCGFLGMRVRVG